jgi:PAS domain S-box-containing protein
VDEKKDKAETAEAELAQREAEFRAIFEDAAIGITVVDFTGRPVRCNPALERILGYTEAELCRMAFPEFTHPDDVQADMDLYQSLLAGERDQYQIEKRYIRKDGQIVWARLTVSLVHQQPKKPEFVVGMVEDITARKLAEEALRESEEKFSKAFHGNPHPIVLSRRADGRILEVNEAFGKWLGITAAEARGKTTVDFGLWKSAKEREEIVKLLEQHGSLQNFEKLVEPSSGESRTMLHSFQPISIRGEDCVLTISTNITQQKQAEEALRQSDERLRVGLAAARMGTWEWNIGSGKIIWTGGVHSLFGLAPGEFGGTLEAFLKLVEPEDRERAQRELEEVVRNPNTKYYSEVRVRWPDGSTHWVEGRGEVGRDGAGKPVTMVGTAVDVTARKEAELALRGSEESLRATIENTPNVAIQWLDEQGRVLRWNRASETVYGWTSDEARDKTLDQLILDVDEMADFLRGLKQVELTGNPVPPTEFLFHRRDGSRGVCLSTIFRVPQGTSGSFFVCIDVDITERKHAEQSLREAQERELRSREEFTRRLLNAQEQERQRLGAELHDSLGQNLSILKNNAYLALAQPGLPPATVEHLNAISQVASDAIAEVRNLAHSLRPLQVEQLGLTDSIRELTEKVAQSTSVHFETRLEDVDDVLQGSSATHLYRIIQEALNNLARHSGARRATISLERDIKCVRLLVSDNGRGFEVKPPAARTGLGLRNMAERAQMLGGSLKIESAPGTGTVLRVEVPVSEVEGPEI